MPVMARQSMQWHRLNAERSEAESSKTSCAASPHRHEMGRVIASVAMVTHVIKEVGNLSHVVSSLSCEDMSRCGQK